MSSSRHSNNKTSGVLCVWQDPQYPALYRVLVPAVCPVCALTRAAVSVLSRASDSGVSLTLCRDEAQAAAVDEVSVLSLCDTPDCPLPHTVSLPSVSIRLHQSLITTLSPSILQAWNRATVTHPKKRVKESTGLAC